MSKTATAKPPKRAARTKGSRASGGVNKAQAIRDTAKKLGHKVRPKDIIAALAAEGITVSSPQVSATLKAAGYRRSRRGGRKTTAGSTAAVRSIEVSLEAFAGGQGPGHQVRECRRSEEGDRSSVQAGLIVVAPVGPSVGTASVSKQRRQAPLGVCLCSFNGPRSLWHRAGRQSVMVAPSPRGVPSNPPGLRRGRRCRSRSRAEFAGPAKSVMQRLDKGRRC